MVNIVRVDTMSTLFDFHLFQLFNQEGEQLSLLVCYQAVSLAGPLAC